MPPTSSLQKPRQPLQPLGHVGLVDDGVAAVDGFGAGTKEAPGGVGPGLVVVRLGRGQELPARRARREAVAGQVVLRRIHAAGVLARR